jgi:hypothetical protein
MYSDGALRALSFFDFFVIILAIAYMCDWAKNADYAFNCRFVATMAGLDELGVQHAPVVCVCVQVTNTKQILEDVKQEAMTRPAVLRGFGVAGVAGVTQLG